MKFLRLQLHEINFLFRLLLQTSDRMKWFAIYWVGNTPGGGGGNVLNKPAFSFTLLFFYVSVTSVVVSEHGAL
jgi:hypothetical protein